MTKSTGVGRGGKRAGAGRKANDGATDVDITLSVRVNEDMARHVMAQSTNVGTALRLIIMRDMLREHEIARPAILKSVAKLPRQPFEPLRHTDVDKEGRRRGITQQIAHERHVDEVNIERRRLYDAGQSYKHVV